MCVCVCVWVVGWHIYIYSGVFSLACWLLIDWYVYTFTCTCVCVCLIIQQMYTDDQEYNENMTLFYTFFILTILMCLY